MFALKEISSIDRSYFKVLKSSPYAITVRSRNTGHCWHIIPYKGASKQYNCIIYHTHHQGNDYHLHGYAPTLEDCLKQIQNHNRYQMKKDAARRERIMQRIQS